jgi:hypothetical protein
MLRKIVLALPVLLLAGCEMPEPSEAEKQIMAACEGGDTQACIALEQIRAQQRQAAAAASAALIQQGAVYNPTYRTPAVPVRTSCSQWAGGVNCTSY